MTKLRSWFSLTLEDAQDIVDMLVPENSDVYEIGCGGKSSAIFGEMLRRGRIKSYKGVNIDSKGVDEAKAQGLEAELVPKNYNHTPVFDKLPLSGKGILVMLGLPEITHAITRMYVAQAKTRGLKIVSYPLKSRAS